MMINMEKWTRVQYHYPLPLDTKKGRVTGTPSQIEIAKKAAAEGMVLLKNDNNILPLAADQKVALFGFNSVDYIKGGWGSGDVVTNYKLSLADGFEKRAAEGKTNVFMPLNVFYRNERERIHNGIDLNEKMEPALSKYEASVPNDLLDSAAKECDIAIISIGRSSGENDDIPYNENGNGYGLSFREKELIEKVKSKFSKIVVFLNVGVVMDLAWCAEDPQIEGILLGLQGGNEGGLVATDILLGDICPSGKLTDTWARSYEDYPSSADYNVSPDYCEYTEDIFVGYRYFETIPGADKKVLYPFGFGLSYTDFSINATADIKEDKITVTAKVKNIGKVSGKEVVQIYTSSPETEIDKPACELRAYAKTPLLAPDEECCLELSFDINDLAVFCEETSSYILEGGEYTLYAGNSVRNKAVVFTFGLEEKVIKKLSSLCAPKKLSRRMNAKGEYESIKTSEYEPLIDTKDWYEGRYWKKEFASLFADDNDRGDFRSFADDESIIKLIDVYEGKHTLEEFMAQLNLEDLLNLTGGCPNQGVANVCGMGDIEDLGVPAIMMADGPAGLRLDSYMKMPTTAFPSGTTMASTWNTELIEECATAAANEVAENYFGIWLAPAANIHRNPLCGRNFEYYSEDPLVSGKSAAASIRGIQSLGISACIKHFCCNNTENNRYESDSILSERALREIYLKGFEIAIKESNPLSVMTSYNKLNGKFAPENKELLTGIVRNEWEYDGLIISDWGSRAEAYREILAGNNIHMPVTKIGHLCQALTDGLLTRKDLEENAKYILKFILRIK